MDDGGGSPTNPPEPRRRSVDWGLVFVGALILAILVLGWILIGWVQDREGRHPQPGEARPLEPATGAPNRSIRRLERALEQAERRRDEALDAARLDPQPERSGSWRRTVAERQAEVDRIRGELETVRAADGR